MDKNTLREPTIVDAVLDGKETLSVPGEEPKSILHSHCDKLKEKGIEIEELLPKGAVAGLYNRLDDFIAYEQMEPRDYGDER